MQTTVYNPQKGRLETIDVSFTDSNTTWFDNPDGDAGVALVADYEGGLLIAGSDYSYPVLVYDLSRADINHDRRTAAELKRRLTA